MKGKHMQNRTHTCNELRLEHVGRKVKISGWMENVRMVGSNFAFVVVRDFYGTTQVVVEDENLIAQIKGINNPPFQWRVLSGPDQILIQGRLQEK